MLTKNNELIVMKACGISLYRIALPMVVCAAAPGGLLFALEESVLGPANRRAERAATRDPQRRAAAPTSSTASGWSATRGEIYHYTYADPQTQRAAAGHVVRVYEDRSRLDRIARRTFAERAVPRTRATPTLWRLEHGWTP